MSAPITNILNELVAALGREAVRAACVAWVRADKKLPAAPAEPAPAPAAPAPVSAKKDRKPRGPNSWTRLVDEVLEEMKAAAAASGSSEKVTRKMAMAEAGRRKRAEEGPDAEAAFQKRKAEKNARRTAKKGGAAAGSSSASSSDAESESEEEAAPEAEEAAPAPAPAPAPAEPDADAIYRYLFKLQARSGVNMMGAPAYLMSELGLSRADASHYTMEYMRNYKTLAKTYSPDAVLDRALKAAQNRRQAGGVDA